MNWLFELRFSCQILLLSDFSLLKKVFVLDNCSLIIVGAAFCGIKLKSIAGTFLNSQINQVILSFLLFNILLDKTQGKHRIK